MCFLFRTVTLLFSFALEYTNRKAQDKQEGFNFWFILIMLVYLVTFDFYDVLTNKWKCLGRRRR
jgi:hypothetical protein